jgi:hypothetical protein
MSTTPQVPDIVIGVNAQFPSWKKTPYFPCEVGTDMVWLPRSSQLSYVKAKIHEQQSRKVSTHS